MPIATLSRIFNELPKAEVFLTLAVGWITAYLPNASAAAQKLGLSPRRIAELASRCAEELDVTDPDRRPDLLAIQQILHHAFTADVRSRFYTPFFIVSRKSNRPYWFLHMANSAKATDVVKTLHWELENHFEHFGGAGLAMLGYDPHADPDVTRQLVFRFDRESIVRTRSTLQADLAPRIAKSYPCGVPFGVLHRDLCNETPATRDLLARAVVDLCVEGDLLKVGAEGERRAPSTSPHDEDLIHLPVQRKLIF